MVTVREIQYDGCLEATVQIRACDVGLVDLPSGAENNSEKTRREKACCE